MPLTLLFVKSCFHQGIGQHLLLSAEPGECVTYTQALFMMIEQVHHNPSVALVIFLEHIIGLSHWFLTQFSRYSLVRWFYFLILCL